MSFVTPWFSYQQILAYRTISSELVPSPWAGSAGPWALRSQTSEVVSMLVKLVIVLQHL